MTGELMASFCERRTEGGTQCLELWNYPDETLNVVVSLFSRVDDVEYAFPCAPHQLVAAMRGDRVLKSLSAEAGLTLSLHENALEASVRPIDDSKAWQQLVPVESIHSALAAYGYLE